MVRVMASNASTVIVMRTTSSLRGWLDRGGVDGDSEDRLGCGDGQKLVCDAGSRESLGGFHVRIEDLPSNRA